jgi:succinylarginine dihydrolase
MTEPAPILVVFGIDDERKPRASRFAERDAELAAKAATLLGFRSAWIKEEARCAIAESLPHGNVFARGSGFVRLVRQSVFEKLSAVIDGGVATAPEQRRSDDQ